MPYCGSCSKLVGIDSDTDPEIDGIEVDDEGTVTGNVRIANVCVDCSQELTEFTFDLEADFSDAIAEHRQAVAADLIKGGASAEDAKRTAEEHDSLEVEHDDGSRIDEYKGKGRRAPHFYGAEVELKVTCKCGEEFSQTWRDLVQASGMDSLS